jgi:hypothetical protein
MNLIVDAILIDDDPLVHATWELAAIKNNKKIISFNSTNEFFEIFSNKNSATVTSQNDIPIYIDSQLGSVKGELIAKDIYNLGYKNIYLITGFGKEHFEKNLYWIKNILDKTPPWLSTL